MKVHGWIRQSNLIEGVDDLNEDARSERAWRWFIKQPLTKESVLRLHRRIMRAKLGREAGHLRICNVTVGGRNCPHYENVPGLFHAWFVKWASELAFLRHGTDNLEDMIKQAHIEFEHIHPFVDGNGRTGRMIMNYQRVKMGLEPLCIPYITRWDYYSWFK